MTHSERQGLIQRPFPSCTVIARRKSWAGAYIRSEPLGRRGRWVALEDEEWLRQLLASEQAEESIDE